MWIATRQALKQVKMDHQFDTEMADWLAHSIGEALANQMPSELGTILEKTKGAPSDSLALKEAKKYSILYMQAAKQGDIDDNAPVKTLMEMYDCGKSTIQSWPSKQLDIQWEKHFPNRKIEQRIHALMTLLKHNSLFYRKESQSQPAITNRNSKGLSK